MTEKSNSRDRVIVPNTGRNLPNMKVDTPMPPVKPPKAPSSDNGKRNG